MVGGQSVCLSFNLSILAKRCDFKDVSFKSQLIVNKNLKVSGIFVFVFEMQG